MQVTDLHNDTENKNWIKLVAGWSLFTSFVYVSLIATILAFVMPASKPNPLGNTYFELMAAGHAPVVYHFSIMFDVLAWIALGGLLAGFAALLRRTAPLRSSLITLLASGTSVGFIGACLRIAGTSSFANKYFAASASQQGSIVQSYDILLQIINILFSAGGLLGGIAMLLVASAAKYLPKLPRWSTVLLGIAGVIHIAKAVAELATGADLGPLALLASTLMIVALIAIAKRLYSSSNNVQFSSVSKSNLEK